MTTDSARDVITEPPNTPACTNGSPEAAPIAAPPHPAARFALPGRPLPKHVAIVAMGKSASDFLALACSHGGVHTIADETWAINATAATLKHDRAFVMDDLRHTIPREAAEGAKVAQGILHWLPSHPGPVYTSTAYPEYPALVEYPLADALQAIGGLPYLNTSVAHAVAFAMLLGVAELSLYGCDFTYPDLHAAESGRGCVEYLLGIACYKGMHLHVPATTTLLDANVPDGKRIYGYHDPVWVDLVDGRVKVTHGPKPPAPSGTEGA